MTIRVFVNLVLVRLGIRHTLPDDCIRKVEIKECNEPLVRIDTNSNITFDKRMEKPIYLRKTVYALLCKFIDDVSKDGYTVKLYDAYRSFDDQLNSWNARLEQTRKEFPDYSEEEVVRATSLRVAHVADKSNVGGHQTGGAIDITLLKDGKEVDMGTRYEEYNSKTITHSSLITKKQKKNRFYMKRKLEKYGFNNFPSEWWHFSYGDKMWSAYKHKKSCIYGYIEPTE